MNMQNVIKLNKSFIILDKQGPFSNVIKHALKGTYLEVHRCRSVKSVIDFIEESPDKNFSFILFIFFEDYELVNCIELYNLNIPVIFAPTDKKSYRKLSRVEGIKLMDLSVNKIEYKIQILNFIKPQPY